MTRTTSLQIIGTEVIAIVSVLTCKGRIASCNGDVHVVRGYNIIIIVTYYKMQMKHEYSHT